LAEMSATNSFLIIQLDNLCFAKNLTV